MFAAPLRPYSAVEKRVERLPFRVRLAGTPSDIEQAVQLRASAYSRHIPKLGEALREPEPEDSQPDVLVLVAERKLDRQVVGTMRLQPNINGPLKLESDTRLPELYRGKRLLESTRLGVDGGESGKMVMVVLAKAAFEICHACGIEYAFAVGRRSMVEIFRTMCYDVVEGPLRLSYASVPLWVMSIPISEVESRLRVREPRYFDFMAQTTHPDIAIDYDRVFETFGSG